MANSKRAALVRMHTNFLRSVVLTLFEWELPPTCDPRILERDLLVKGSAALFWDNTFECFVNTSITAQGNLDMYGMPRAYNCIGVGYQRTMPRDAIAIVYNALGGLYGGEANIVYFDLDSIIRQYANLLADCDIGIRNEVECTKHPAVIAINDSKQEKSVREAWRQASDGEVVVITDSALLGNMQAQLFPLPRESFLADKQQAKQAIFQEFLYRIGVNSLAYEKSERLITAEADVSEQSVSLPLQNLLIPRIEACKKFYSLYGVKISVKPRTINASKYF